MRVGLWMALGLWIVGGTMHAAECKGRVELKLSEVPVNGSQFFYYVQVLNKTDKQISYDLSFSSMGARGRIHNTSMKGFAPAKGSSATLKVGGGNSGFASQPVSYDNSGGGVTIQHCTP